MPVYAFHCPGCGPFDRRRAMSEATEAAPCPSCHGPGRRVYTAPGVRSARGRLAAAVRGDAARVDWARTGEPVVTGPPAGHRLPHATSHRH